LQEAGRDVTTERCNYFRYDVRIIMYAFQVGCDSVRSLSSQTRCSK